MRLILIFLFGMMGLGFLIYSFDVKNTEDKVTFVVVELYTSQGCSSCPSADKVLEEIGEVYKGKNVIPLGFHVDYWDRLGWKDTFSQHQFSKRQYAYGQRFKNTSVYTPQMIVNGTSQFVGSNKSKAFGLIDKKIKEQVVVKIGGKVTGSTNKLVVKYSVSDIKPDLYNLNMVLVRNKVKVNIKRGENRNREITYKNIVIDFKSLSSIEKSGTLEINRPKNYKKEDYTIVLFLQEKDHGAIIGATRLIHS